LPSGKVPIEIRPRIQDLLAIVIDEESRPTKSGEVAPNVRLFGMDDIPIHNLQSKLAFGADHVEEFCLFLKGPWRIN
jgi:hypothetical protein